ncbi:MAG: hypothetical protein A4E63_00207 [Syntrophorhabdus sp. PtaU1.Bin050]|nr:MAG: hypothetical protein A4E63_00207 [Syntrophorhabdus sp. PtaU1.Bin050]
MGVVHRKPGERKGILDMLLTRNVGDSDDVTVSINGCDTHEYVPKGTVFSDKHRLHLPFRVKNVSNSLVFLVTLIEKACIHACKFFMIVERDTGHRVVCPVDYPVFDTGNTDGGCSQNCLQFPFRFFCPLFFHPNFSSKYPKPLGFLIILAG